jgi:recombinational DNA repair protein (RecF pathway)
MTNNKYSFTKSDNIGLLTEIEQVESFDNLRESKSGKFEIFYISEILSYYLTSNEDLWSLYKVVFSSFQKSNANKKKVFIEILRICFEIIEREQEEYETICLVCEKEIQSKNIKNFSDFLICEDCHSQKNTGEEKLINKNLERKTSNKAGILIKKLSLTNELIENIINRNIKSFNFLFYKQ